MIVECFVFVIFLIFSAEIDETADMNSFQLQNAVVVVIITSLLSAIIMISYTESPALQSITKTISTCTLSN